MLLAVWVCLAPPAAAVSKRVTAGSADNRVAVTVRNPNDDAAVDGLELAVVGHPRWVRSVSVRADSSGPLPPGEERVFTVSFAVAADVPAGEFGELELQVGSGSEVLADVPKTYILLFVDSVSTPAGDEDRGPGGPGGSPASPPGATGGPPEAAAPERRPVRPEPVVPETPEPEPPAAAPRRGLQEPSSRPAAGTPASAPAPGARTDPAPVGMPDVVGLEVREAHARLTAAGFTPALELGPDAPSAEQVHTVASQSRGQGDEVVLVVYSEVSLPGRRVPALVGRSLGEARALLGESDLFADIEVDRQPPRAAQAGQVYRQYPEPGIEVPRGTGVRLWAYVEWVSPVTPAGQPGDENGGRPGSAAGGASEPAGGERSAAGTPGRAGGRSAGGVPELTIPHSFGAARFSYATICGERVEAADVLRRPPGGFDCGQGFREILLVYARRHFSSRYLWLRWLEPGDGPPRGLFPVVPFCQLHEKIHNLTDAIGDPWAVQGHQRVKAQAVLKTGSDVWRLWSEDAVPVFRTLLGQVEPYAEACD